MTRPQQRPPQNGKTDAGDEPLILNVDDTEAIRYAKTRTLKRAGYTVIEASSGGEALAMVATRRPALALLDVKLPDMSGLQVCEIIKRDHPSVLVLQISATYVSAADKIRGLGAGADAYLVQPVEPDELAAAVAALLRLREGGETLRRANEGLELRVAERTEELATPTASCATRSRSATASRPACARRRRWRRWAT